MSDNALLNSVTAFLYREAECVDERRWDEWLTLLDPKVEYWIPSWDSEDEYTSDPQSEISLMYYGDRSGLEDRVFRLRTGRSAASTPLPRTCHMVSNIRATPDAEGRCIVKANWVTHLFRNGVSQTIYGRSEYLLLPQPVGSVADWRIVKKKILVLNDLVDTVLDIYSV